jgi:hypothetical protein
MRYVFIKLALHLSIKAIKHLEAIYEQDKAESYQAGEESLHLHLPLRLKVEPVGMLHTIGGRQESGILVQYSRQQYPRAG